ncbi:MAG: cytochrome c-type biogenesis protein CcmH [Rickettsiales bacterium]|nr:cytochrome c-type biogenesis protein CcmH [Rickettsiales bacterium]
MKVFLISILLLLIINTNSQALRVEEKLPRQQEERAIELFLKVRCLVCNGQVIENSDADFAFEMRKLIRKKIVDGLSDEEIKTYLINNFGEEILTDLNNKTENYTLFLLPILFATVILFFLRRNLQK